MFLPICHSELWRSGDTFWLSVLTFHNLFSGNCFLLVRGQGLNLPYVTQAAKKDLIFIRLFRLTHKCWEYRCVPLCLITYHWLMLFCTFRLCKKKSVIKSKKKVICAECDPWTTSQITSFLKITYYILMIKMFQ